MGEVITIGLDIAKSVFQIHGVDDDGAVVIRKRVSRGKILEFFADLPPCLVGIEACPTAHHWSRQLQSLGHTVKLMPPSYVKAYLKRAKNDANDAAAICEAVTRPSMRFVATKSKEQQAALMLHRSRQLLVRQRTMLSNAIRGQLAEFGIVASTGRLGFNRLLEMVDGPEELGIPKVAWVSLMALAEQHQRLQVEIGKLEQCIQAWHRSSELSRRLEEIPGVGPIVATALVGTITDPHAFASGRHMAAWIGLVPQQNSTGGKDRLGGITKQGNRYPALAACCRCDGRDPLRAETWHSQAAVAGASDRAKADQGCGRRACQQDGAHRLGDHDPWRALSCANPAHRLIAVERATTELGGANERNADIGGATDW